jgi:hypothetical protein
VQAADHVDRQASAAIEHFGDAGPGAENALQILSREPLLLDPELDRLDRIRWVDRVMLALIGVDQGSQHIEPVTFRRARAGAPQPIDLCQGYIVVRFTADRLDLTQDRPP